MQLILSLEESTLLMRALDRHIEEMDAELVRTDKAELQHALGGEVRMLRGLRSKLGAADAQPARVTQAMR